MTNDPDIRFASSMIDYVFRRLALDYLPPETREGLGIQSIAERTDAVHAEVARRASSSRRCRRRRTRRSRSRSASGPRPGSIDAPLCYQCGSKMQPAGSCYVCSSCGSTSGCS